MIRIVLLSALLGILAAACAIGDVKLEAGDENSQVELNKGQFLTVSLEGNPTTGFTWEAADLDDQILRQVGEAQFSPDSDLIGAGGTQTLRFEALNSGQTTLGLVYRRPWEDKSDPLKIFSVRVVVR